MRHCFWPWARRGCPTTLLEVIFLINEKILMKSVSPAGCCSTVAMVTSLNVWPVAAAYLPKSATPNTSALSELHDAFPFLTGRSDERGFAFIVSIRIGFAKLTTSKWTRVTGRLRTRLFVGVRMVALHHPTRASGFNSNSWLFIFNRFLRFTHFLANADIAFPWIWGIFAPSLQMFMSSSCVNYPFYFLVVDFLYL